jgi:hypothetical protein
VVPPDRGRFNVHGVKGAQDEIPEEVIAEAPDEGRLRPEFRYGDRHVRRRAAWAGCELELYFGRCLLLVDVRHLAFGTYLWDDAAGKYLPGGLDVLTIWSGQVTEVTSFLSAWRCSCARCRG